MRRSKRRKLCKQRRQARLQANIDYRIEWLHDFLAYRRIELTPEMMLLVDRAVDRMLEPSQETSEQWAARIAKEMIHAAD